MQIYKITNLINNKIYIGKDTTSDPNYFGSGLLIKRSLKKYGIENFIKEIIYETDDYDELSKKEIYWIFKYESTNKDIGYNISSGGDGGDTLSNHPDLDIIKEKISNNSKTKGKTYEEAFGIEKAKSYKDKLSKSNKRITLGRTFDEIYSPDESNRIKKCISDNNKKNWTNERKKKHSNNSKSNIYKSLLSPNSIENNRKYLEERWCNYKEKEKKYIINCIENSNVEEMLEYLKKIPNSLFKNRIDFYEFIGDANKMLVKDELFRGRNNKKDNIRSKIILIDNNKYNSISEASKQLNLDRSLIRFRLKSSNFKNYLYKDDDLNIKYNKYIDIDPYLSKKERISIDNKIYESITDATKELNKSHDYINWRLNSKSYPNWSYLDKVVELKETGIPKLKSVSINGVQYESISNAVIGSGIDRQVMRYRLKSKNYTEYFYI